MDMQSMRAFQSITDISPDFDGTSRCLSEMDSSTNVVFFLGVLERTFGVPSLIRALFSACLSQVTVAVKYRKGSYINGSIVCVALYSRNGLNRCSSLVGLFTGNSSSCEQRNEFSHFDFMFFIVMVKIIAYLKIFYQSLHQRDR